MNDHMRFSQTIEMRLAGGVMRVLRHMANRYGRSNVMDHVDHKDFTDYFVADMQPALRLELLRVRLEALQVQPDDREAAKRKTLEEIRQIESSLKQPRE